MSSFAFLLVTGALLLTGCLGSGGSDTVVPWPDTPLTAAPTSPAPLTPPCRADDVQARLFLEGAGGALVGGVVLTNAGSDPCSLTGRPGARFAGATASSTRSNATAMRSFPSGDSVAAPLSSLRAFPPRAKAWVALHWSNWCPPGTGATSSGAPPAALVLVLPEGGGDLRMRVDDGSPRCDAPDAPSTLGIAPFRPRGREPTRSTRIPLRVSFPGVAHPEAKVGRSAFQAARGSVFRYEIGLTNFSHLPFSFERCPVLVEKLSPAGRGHSYVLNCKPAGRFAPGERKTFAMELVIPRAAPLGRNALIWRLGPRTWEPPWAPATLLVTR